MAFSTVHSTFEHHPERKITLRMLLSHTAGFTHEAPIGNDYEREPGSFEVHVHSFSDTWLRFLSAADSPTPTWASTAAATSASEWRQPFTDVVRDSLLGPPDRGRNTFDRTAIRAARNRAVWGDSILVTS